MNKAKRILTFALALMAALPLLAGFRGIPAEAEEETVIETRKTPLMGWASWNCFHTAINEDVILAQAQALVDLGLADLGYVFVNTDDGFQKGRDAEGYVTNNKETFPAGMRSLADKIHALGLKAGIYTDGGEKTCASIYAGLTSNTDCGLYGNEEKDLRRYLIDWDFDFIKVDWCGGLALNLDRQTQYTKIGNIIKEIEKETGKDKLFNVCSASFPGEWVTEVADSWRMSYDITCNFEDILSHIDQAKVLAEYNGPGHVNDLDMMEVGNGLSYDEDRTHFSMWCMMSTPLLLGMDLRSISDETLSIISNRELIALDQDALCVQGHLIRSYGEVEVWMKELASGEVALAFLNRSDKEQKLLLDLEELGFYDVAAVRDLWAHCDMPYDGGLYLSLPAHGTDVYRFEYTAGEGMIDTRENDDGTLVDAETEAEDLPTIVDPGTLGNYDWIHDGLQLDRMPDGAEELTVAYKGERETYQNGSTLYRYKTPDRTMVGLGKTGVRLSGEDAAAEISADCDQTERTLSVVVGGYSADVKVTVFVGGKVVGRLTVFGKENEPTTKLLKVTYHSDKPTKAVVRSEIEKELNEKAAVQVECAALSIYPQGSAILPVKVQYAAKVTRINYRVYAEKAASCLIAVKDEKGELVGLQVAEVEKNKWTNGAQDFTLGAGFTGTAEVYLWKDNLPLTEKREIPLNTAAASNYFIGPMTAKTLVKKGAMLIDVRSKEEYDAGHLDGAVHLPYDKVGEMAEKVLPDKNGTYILYCSMAKRSAQALGRLRGMGYNAVFTIGSMTNYEAFPQICYGNGTFTIAVKGDIPEIYCIGTGYDEPEILVAYGEEATFADAKPVKEAAIPDFDGDLLTAKVYLSVDGECCMEETKKAVYYKDGMMDVYASDLNFTKQTCGWGSVKKDRSNEGNALKLQGRTYKKGIGTHATSEIEMKIPEGMTRFLALAGIDDETSGGQCDFSVRIDGETVSAATVQSGKTAVFDIAIPQGAKTITLYVYEGAGGNYCDHADWCIAGFGK